MGTPAFSRRTVMAAMTLPWTAGAVQAASFPERKVRIVVPYGVGVGPDVIARSMAESLEQRWGKTVLIDNKPGASGIVAFSELRRTPPDGHTLFVADTATLAVNPLLHDTLPYDPVQDLVPLTLMFHATFVIWVGGSHRVGSLADLVRAARARPGGVSYASLGNGHASHVAIETFARAAGLTMLHIPFKDVGALQAAVVSGDVDFTAFSVNTMLGLWTAGRLRPLCVAARERLPDHREIPTIVEAGGPAVQMHPWAALVAVAGTPLLVLEQLQRDAVAALASAEVLSRAAQSGFEITPTGAQALRERISADVALYGPLVREGRIARM